MEHFLNDSGIFLELLGFAFIILTGGRDPNTVFIITSQSKDSKFNKFREKIIPDQLVIVFYFWGIFLVVLGLILQMGFFKYL